MSLPLRLWQSHSSPPSLSLAPPMIQSKSSLLLQSRSDQISLLLKASWRQQGLPNLGHLQLPRGWGWRVETVDMWPDIRIDVDMLMLWGGHTWVWVYVGVMWEVPRNWKCFFLMLRFGKIWNICSMPVDNGKMAHRLSLWRCHGAPRRLALQDRGSTDLPSPCSWQCWQLSTLYFRVHVWIHKHYTAISVGIRASYMAPFKKFCSLIFVYTQNCF